MLGLLIGAPRLWARRPFCSPSSMGSGCCEHRFHLHVHISSFGGQAAMPRGPESQDINPGTLEGLGSGLYRLPEEQAGSYQT